MKRLSSGQTIAEIIIAISVVVLLITGLIVGSSVMLRSARSARAKSVSVTLAREGLELARKIRDTQWATFVTYGTPAGKTWCLDGTGVWTVATGACSVNVNNLYTRSVVFTWNDPKMTVVVTVSWQDGVQTLQSDVTSIFTQWR